MLCWLLFHHDLNSGAPETWELHRFKTAAERMGIRLSVLKPRDFDLVVDTDAGWSAMYQGRHLPKPDLIIARTGSETSYFTLAVLRHFERQGIPLANGSEAIASVADKLHSLQILSRADVPAPKTILGKFPVDVDVVERELGFPVVVKVLRSTRGAGVLLCADRQQFHDLASLLDEAQTGADFLFQQYIKTSHGRDVRLLVVDGQVIGAMQRTGANGNFKSNIAQGGRGERIEPPAAMEKIALRAARALNLEIAGVDILYDADGYKVCEVNSAPGFQAFQRVCDVDVAATILEAMRKKFGLKIGRRRSLIDKVRGLLKPRPPRVATAPAITKQKAAPSPARLS